MSRAGSQKKVVSTEVELSLFYTESVDRFHASVCSFPVRVSAIIEYSSRGVKAQTCWPQKVRITSNQLQAISKTGKGRSAFRKILSEAFERQENVRLSWNGVTLEELLEIQG